MFLKLLSKGWGHMEVTLLCMKNVRLSVRKLNTLSYDSSAEQLPEEVRVEPSDEELDGAEPWMVDELTRYYQGRRRLADMMGVPADKFTDKDVEDALRYLLPSRLFARDARPSMKHPFKIFPERKEALFDKSGRPLDAGFYTGSPAYHSLAYQIFEKAAELAQTSYTQQQAQSLLILSSKQEDMSSEGTEMAADAEQSSSTEAAEAVTDSTASEETKDEVNQEEKEMKEDKLSIGNDRPKVWIKKESLENMIAEELSDKQYSDLIGRLSALAAHPNSSLICSFLDTYRHPVFSYRSISHAPTPSEDGSVTAIGKRKTATAAVTLREGSGVITVNKKTLTDYFPRTEDRSQVLYPLIITQLLGEYDVNVSVRGGGTTGQSGAIRLGISKALLGFSGNHGDILEGNGLLVRDHRMVERKKPGQKKARKKFAWVKR